MARYLSGSFFALVALLTACASETGPPSDPVTIGIVAAVEGSPAVIRLNRPYIIGVRSRIYEGDIVETDRFSAAHIDMADGARIEVGRDSRLVFHRYQNGAARLTLTAGAIHSSPGSGDKPIRLEVQTPVALIRSRGAEFFGGFISAENTLDIGLLQGDGIGVSNVHGAVEIRNSGEGTTVIGGTAPQASRPWTPRKIERTLAEMEINN